MARYIHYYKTKSDFRKDYNDPDKYKTPWLSYVKRKNRSEAYPVNYNRSSVIITPPQYLWIDDFPDGTNSEGCGAPYQTPYDQEFCECFYDGYQSIYDYFDEYLENPWSDHGNLWEYVGDMEFEGNEYFVYELPGFNSGNPAYGLMPKIYTIEQLEDLSIYSDYDNRFQPFDYILDDETGESVAYTMGHEGNPGDDFVLVKVIP